MIVVVFVVAVLVLDVLAVRFGVDSRVDPWSDERRRAWLETC